MSLLKLLVQLQRCLIKKEPVPAKHILHRKI